MNLQEIERALKKHRMESPNKTVGNKGKPLQKAIVFNVEDGGKYSIRSLINYAAAIGKTLTVDGVEIHTAGDFGKLFTKYRKAKGLTQVRISQIAHFTPNHVHDIENGKSFRRDTLLRFMKALGQKFDFNLIDINNNKTHDYGNTENTEVTEE